MKWASKPVLADVHANSPLGFLCVCMGYRAHFINPDHKSSGRVSFVHSKWYQVWFKHTFLVNAKGLGVVKLRRKPSPK